MRGWGGIIGFWRGRRGWKRWRWWRRGVLEKNRFPGARTCCGCEKGIIDVEWVDKLVVCTQHVNIERRFDEIEVSVRVDGREEGVILFRAKAPPLNCTLQMGMNPTVWHIENFRRISNKRFKIFLMCWSLICIYFRKRFIENTYCSLHDEIPCEFNSILPQKQKKQTL